MKPYPEQVEAVDAVYRAGSGLIIAPTGFGKSVVVALILERFQLQTLIVVPTLNLKVQLTSSLNTWFGEGTAGPLSAKGQPMHPVTVMNIDGLCPKTVLKGIQLVIVDEVHHVAANSYVKLNKNTWGGVYHRVGLTATGFRSREHERLLFESFLSKVVYKVTYETAVSRGYIVPLEVYYVDAPKYTGDADFHRYADAYRHLIVENDGRNAMLSELIQNLDASGESALAIVKQVEHGQRLQDLSGAHIPFIKGENEDNEALLARFNEGGQTAIGTHGCVGEGIDSRPCQWVIICSPMKSKNLFMQCLGRAFRRFPGKTTAKVVLVRDTSHKWFKAAFKEQEKILLEEYGLTPTKI